MFVSSTDLSIVDVNQAYLIFRVIRLVVDFIRAEEPGVSPIGFPGTQKFYIRWRGVLLNPVFVALNKAEARRSSLWIKNRFVQRFIPNEWIEGSTETNHEKLVYAFPETNIVILVRQTFAFASNQFPV